MAEWMAVRPQNWQGQKRSSTGRGVVLAVVAGAAVLAILALTAPQGNSLQQIQLARPAAPAVSWTSLSASQQQALKTQWLQESAPPSGPPIEPVPPVAPGAPVAPVATVAPPVAPLAPVVPMAPVAAVPPVVSVAPVSAVAPVGPVAPVAPVAPMPPPAFQPRMARAAPRLQGGSNGALAPRAEEEADEAAEEQPKEFNANLDKGGARSYGMQNTEDGKKDWHSIGMVHGGKTMAQAGGMGDAGPATAEAGLDATLEDYAKVQTERRQAMDFCSAKFSDWGNIQKCISLLFKNAHY